MVQSQEAKHGFGREVQRSHIGGLTCTVSLPGGGVRRKNRNGRCTPTPGKIAQCVCAPTDSDGAAAGYFAGGNWKLTSSAVWGGTSRVNVLPMRTVDVESTAPKAL